METIRDDEFTSASMELTVTEATASSPIVAGNSLSTAHHFVSVKLTNRNYLFWRTQLLPFFRGQGLLGYVDGTIPCPELPSASSMAVDGVAVLATSLAVSRTAWRQQDQAILLMLDRNAIAVAFRRIR
nr:chromatin target of PRMT1 protein-like [Ipomoea batatas]